MDFTQAIVEVGKQAVRRYREKPEITNETKIPETCLGRFIASELISRFCWQALPEVHYTDMLIDLDISQPDVVRLFGGQRADIAVYQDHRPVAVVELKIADEGRSLYGIVQDWSKIRLLQQFASSRGGVTLDGYVAALVCDTNKPSEQTINELEQALGNVTVQRGEKVRARAGGWEWQFVCGKVV